MSDFRHDTAVQGRADMATDAGLRSFMLGVYNKLALGLVVAGGLAWTVGNVPAVQQLFYTQGPDGALAMSPLGWIVQFAPLVLIFGSMFLMKRPNPVTTNLLYWAVVATMGASLGWIFLVYSGASVATTFFVTAAAFAGLSLFGYTTKRDLSAMGSFLIMGLFGLIIASLVNIFMQSSAMEFAISVLGVGIFAGLTAYDTQTIKEMYYEGDDRATAGRKAIMGALNLYMDFINLFIMLLRLIGDRR